jgi:hypothetical protein
MLRQHSISRALLTKYCGPAMLAAAALLLVGNATRADDGNGNKGNEAGDDRAVRLLQVVPVPVSNDNNTAGGLYSYDISWVDQKSETYYLADRSNKAVDILDAANPGTVTQLKASPPFAGASPPAGGPGPNGVTTGGHCLFVTDFASGGRVVSFDTTSFPPTQVSSVSTGGSFRADELAFDPKDKLLLVINNADTPPFGTFVKVTPASCILTPPTSANKVNIDTAHGVDAEGGAEQPVWDGDTGLFYLSIPQIGGLVSHGGVVSIPPNGTKYTVLGAGIDFCSPAGLALGPKGDLFVGCNAVFGTDGKVWVPNGTVTAAPNDVIIDAKDGSIDTRVLGVGAGDEVTFNAGDGNYYATGSGSPFRPIDTAGIADAKGSTPLGVVDAKDQKVLQQLTTYNVPATPAPIFGPTGHPAGTAHSVAADDANSHVFVPLAANNAFSSFASPPVPGAKAAPDCETGCIAIFGHPDEDPGNPQKDD